MVPLRSDRVSRAPPYSRIFKSSTPTGLSPTTAGLSRPFSFSLKNHWPAPLSLATTSGISVDVFSSGYLDISVPRVRLQLLCIQNQIPSKGWVSPFGHPRINDRSHLPAAFRSVPRPSSPLSAKASTDLYAKKENIKKSVVAIFFLTLMVSAYLTEVIGIHALFGAFMAGAIMPDITKFRNVFIEKVEDVSVILLLPLFFVFTGLRTEIGLINEPYLWKITGYIILVAVVGKFFGSALAARFVGQNWRESWTIGALMNTRDLMF